MSFIYSRTIHFADTDAAGVVYFANVLSICHEAYEASLQAAGIDLNSFFRSSTIAMPIIHAEVRFLQPMFCGETYHVHLQITASGTDKFTIAYQIQVPTTQQITGTATTTHLCINPTDRTRHPLPREMQRWLEQCNPVV